ncbi:hypothetical protein FP435_04490 [Lactobacillus sp. PV037]|uniref:phage tail spike protein n=1 Tax=Lactobacillus sp. PV037 TaxID=2594496 RepID=UPI00223F7C45|nr:phage tail spike protein [Lactobacillus sp. PV037]QNQ83752.1 hypothetical protein FP435_04490 [Lactobacillus sp. PV037]
MPVVPTLDDLEEEYGEYEVEEQPDQYLMRFPILYERASDNDYRNGLGALSDTLSCTVTRTANAFPTLQMTYKVEGQHATEIIPGRIIMTDMGPDLLHQKFRITQVQKSLEGLAITANHIAADIANNTITSDIVQNAMSAADTFNTIINSLAEPMPQITFNTDVYNVSAVNFPMTTQAASNLLLDPDQMGDTQVQSMVSLYGGYWVFDNYEFNFRQNPGSETTQTIRYGRNLSTLTQDKNIDGTYTAIYPYAKYTPQTPKATETNVDWNSIGDDYTEHAEVTYAAGASIDIYNTPIMGHKKIGSVKAGQKINTVKIVKNDENVTSNEGKTVVVETVNGDDWVRITSPMNGWIDSTYLTVDKTGTYVVNDVIGNGHIDVTKSGGNSIKYAESGKVVVNYPGGIYEWYSPYKGPEHYHVKKKGKDVVHKLGEPLTYDEVAIDEQGRKWYHLGNGNTHRWIFGPHTSQSKEGSYITSPARGTAVIKKNAQSYTKPGEKASKTKTKVSTRTKKTKPTKKISYYTYEPRAKTANGKKTKGKYGDKKKVRHTKIVANPKYYGTKTKYVKTTLKQGAWKVTKQTQINGETYYWVPGQNRWVKSGDVNWKAAKAYKPPSIEKVRQDLIDKTGRVELYETPAGKTLKDGNISIADMTSVTITKTAVAGKTGGDTTNWSYVILKNGKEGWILSKYLKYTKSGEVAPHAKSAESSENQPLDTINNNEQGEVMVDLGGVVYAPNAYDTEVARVENVDLSSYFTHDNTDTSGERPDGTWEATDKDREQLYQLALNYMTENRIGYPVTSLTVDYQQYDHEEFDLSNVNLYDRVKVVYPALGVDETAMVSSTTWDAIAHKYTSHTIGELPITYEHLMANAVQDGVDKSAGEINDRTDSLLGRYHSMLKLEGTDRKRAEKQMMKDMGLIREVTNKNGKRIDEQLVTNKRFEEQMNKIDSAAQESLSWIRSGGGGVIHAYPDWTNPTELQARSSDGGHMYFSAQGLGYTDATGQVLRGAIDSQGRVYAEAIKAGTIDAVNITSCLVESALTVGKENGMQIFIGTNKPVGTDLSPMNGGNVIWLTSPNYSSMVSSGQISVEGFNDSFNGGVWGIEKNAVTTISPTHITVGSSGNEVLTYANFDEIVKAHAKSWVQDWVADYITVNGKRHTIWKG